MDSNKCTTCHYPRDLPNRKTCSKCNERSKKYYVDHKAERKAYNIKYREEKKKIIESAKQLQQK